MLNVKLVMKMIKKEDALLVLLVNSPQILAMPVITALEGYGLHKLLQLAKVTSRFMNL